MSVRFALPITFQHRVPPPHRRRRPAASKRPLGLLMLALVLCAGAVLVSRALPARASAKPVARALRHPPVVVPSGASQLSAAGYSFETGACEALPPTGRSRGRTVFVDPGHGGPDPGSAGPGTGGGMVLEKDATLGIALDLARRLRADGYRVVLARTGDTSVVRLTDADFDGGSLRGSALHRDLVARVACANAAHADLLLSIHLDAFEDSSVGGSETIYDPDRPFAAASGQLAAALQRAVVAELGVDDRGVMLDTELDAGAITEAGDAYGHLVELGPALAGWVDQPSAMPGALVEPLFVSDPPEADLAASDTGRARIASALEAGIAQYLGAAATRS